MVEIKKLVEDQFRDIAAQHPFELTMLTKDYYITLLLYLIKDVKGIHFKGGTALQKIFLNHSRLSEDIDFSVSRNIKIVREGIISIIKKTKVFEDITEDKRVEKFVRLIAHYRGFSGEKGTIFIDLNEKDILLRKPEEHRIAHFYNEFIPEFSISTLAEEEMIAEKVRAAITRNKPRDHFDVYKIIKFKIPVNLKLVKEKCKQTDAEFSIIKMFNKAKQLKNRWDADVEALLAEEIPFQEVIKALAKHFKLKEEKEKLKKR
ncbi:MAG: nucleotidyl transferase AbiEii/AbiGii toxin family protein [Nanoarchaeota archaeon]|nr:nucleotidyl transferase AbiEii/AbiGii toxin family protein [Nanoarchaeota archaeon]